MRHRLGEPAPGLACRLRCELGRWYDAHCRDLPWRRTRDPYAVWVSEAMLQQTRVATVIAYYERWMARFPAVTDLAAADLQAVLKLWEGLGYYARARHLHQAARIVALRHGGRVPDDPAAFAALPGVGDYTAAAVLSIAFGRALAVVDGNVKRVLSRFHKLEAPANDPKAHGVFASLAARWLDAQDPGRFNQSVMELGALVCTVRRPRCGDCPLAADCRSLAQGCQADYPRRLARSPVPEHLMVAAVIFKKGRLLIVQRPAERLLGGLWEFPAARLSAGLTARCACSAFLLQMLNIRVRIEDHPGRIHHAYTHFKIQAEVLRCAWQEGRVRRRGPTAHRWVRPGRLADFPLTGAARKVHELICSFPPFTLKGGLSK